MISNLLKLNKVSNTLNFSLRNFATKTGNDQVKVNFNRPFKTYLLEKGPENNAVTNKKELIDYFTEMSRMRRIEIVADGLYKKKYIRGFCHLYNGQEAVCAGMEYATTKDDHVITAYRDHTFMMARGATPKEILAELLMKEAGCSKGKGGSMHMFTKNFYGGNGIVGAQVPVGAGIALTQKYNKTGNVCMAYYGDGAANQGQIFEAYNMASLWKLPIIFICENNHYGMGTSTKRAAASQDFYTRGHFVPGLWVDGMNIFSVREAGKFAADFCRKGNGPIVLEMDTYRYVGHSMSDPGTTYRTREEVNEVRASQDPIEYVRHLILTNKLATEDELQSIEDKIREEMDEAADFAINAPLPPNRDLFTKVYVNEVPVRGVEKSLSFKP
ncbi:pyruvate dehydrogenase E1 alpha subunit [Tieghemostelium lacteum]|uniref:Pyruvate dehydrogenase E1 component subunit alpha n=1 Tax=Tieghemostelium lacteum TaxID=361077 RepID=A0A152A1A0_TIELA|nr:pyruvate dehydrogenase E1 alpha subunit [Tieghemostelium lacteum]|eukprot:KYQ99896.1 pyruvate dehydrogenase E1 alpha subunit [Tieghemostelium lacteum]